MLQRKVRELVRIILQKGICQKKKKANFIDTTDRKKRTETAFLNGGRENKAGFVEEGDSQGRELQQP